MLERINRAAERLWRWMTACPEQEREPSHILSVFHVSVLAFPVIVVLLASVALICHGRCAAWQWWGGVAATLLLIWRMARDRRELTCCVGLFVGMLGVLWVLGGVLVQSGGIDPFVYHLPAIHLLIEGWNPVWQGNWDAIEKAFGIGASEVRPWMILSMPKSVWYFDAVAYFFIGNPFNLLYPLKPLLMLSIGFSIWMCTNRLNKVCYILFFCLVINLLPSARGHLVDNVVALAGIGLLMSMWGFIKSNRWHWGELLCYSFWMCTAKQPSMLHCFVFWLVFGCTCLWVKRFACAKCIGLVAFVLAICGIVVCVSPFISSYVNFGHPLYPRYTCDEAKYPVENQCADFLNRNEDAAAMGHMGAAINSYISPKVAEMYYKCKFGKGKFRPHADSWSYSVRHLPWLLKFRLPWSDGWEFQGSRYSEQNTLTCASFRMIFLFCVLFLLLLGKLEDRMVVFAVIGGMLSMPTEMIGYFRYVPWMVVVVVLVPFSVCAGRFAWWKLGGGFILGCICLVCVMYLSLLLILQLDKGYALRMTLKDPVAYSLFDHRHCEFSNWNLSYWSEDAALGNIKLLIRRSKKLSQCRISDVKQYDEKTSELFFDESFSVNSNCNIWAHSPYRAHISEKNRLKRLCKWPLFVLRTFFVTLPKIVWLRLTEDI